MSDQRGSNPPSQRLKGALSSISTSEMKAVRAEVQQELNELEMKLPPPSIVPKADPEPGPDSLHPSDIDDLNKARKVASDFMLGMDRIADVLMLLVMKFGRASTMMRAVFIGNLVGVLLLTVNLLVIWQIGEVQVEIQERQERMQEQQTQILEKQGTTQKVAGEAKEQAEAAAQKAQNAPEVGVDSKGQLILKVPDPGSPGETQEIRLPTTPGQRNR